MSIIIGTQKCVVLPCLNHIDDNGDGNAVTCRDFYNTGSYDPY